MELPEEAQRLVANRPDREQRSDRLLAIAMALGKEGWTNHEILVVVEKYGSRWRTLPPVSRNRFARYKKLMQLIAAVRKRYPSHEEASE